MGANSKISWTVNTFNPWIGCQRVHTGCLHCYAETYAGYTGIADWGPGGTRILTKGPWKEVAKWNEAAKARGEKELTFCASLADVFEFWRGPMTATRNGDVWHVAEDGKSRIVLPRTEYRDGYRLMGMGDARVDLFRMVDKCQNLVFQMLTKRPENIKDFWPKITCPFCEREPCEQAEECSSYAALCFNQNTKRRTHRENVWLGTSISDQETADKVGPRLKAARDLVPVLFYSIEPLVGKIERLDLEGIDWVIIGGESGAGARPCNLQWIRDIIAICRAAGVPVFVKQIGANAEEWDANHRGMKTGPHVSNLMKDEKGGDIEEWPERWCISFREWPEHFSPAA